MHWSTARALNTIARERHAQLDAALTDRIHRDPDPQAKTDLFSGCQSSSVSTPDVLSLLHTEADAPSILGKENTKPTATKPSTTRNGGSCCAGMSSSMSRCAECVAA